MSRENVEVVRACLEAWGRGGLDAAAKFLDTEIDWRAAEGAPDDPGPIHGVDSMRAYAQDWLDDFDELSFEPEELIDAGEQVVAVQRVSGRAKASGIETELRFAVVYTIRDGKIVRGREYWERAQALEAVGLSEYAISPDDADTIRRAYEVWNESGPEAVTERFWAEDAVYREGPGWPGGGGVFRGRAAALARMQALIELAGPIEVDLEELIEVGDGRFVACTRMVGESASSEGPYTQSFAVVQRVRDGLIVQADYYLDRAQALEAVGLSA